MTQHDSNQEQLRKLTRAVEQLGSTIVITDLSGNIEYVNPRFTELTGYLSEEVIGKNPRILKSGLTPQETYVDLWQTVLSGKVWSGEVRNKRKDGSLYWGKLTVAPIKNDSNTVTHLAGVEEDITPFKELHQALSLSNEAFERANESLNEFSSNAAHDLKSPLFSFLSGLKMIEKIVKNKTDSSGTEIEVLIGKMELKVKEMGSLINNLLQYARSGVSNKFSSEVDTGKIACRTIESLSGVIEARNALVTFEDLPVISADEILVVQLFQNLIENAIKFNKDEQPRVQISCVETKSAYEFSVQDNGIGISKEDIGRIFIPFQRLSAEFGGSGLGLANCKKIVELHGGKIWVEPNREKGSTFKFTIAKLQTENTKSS